MQRHHGCISCRMPVRLMAGIPEDHTGSTQSGYGTQTAVSGHSVRSLEDQNRLMQASRATGFLSTAARHGLLLWLLLLSGCNSLNPLCGSARPAPVLDSVSPSTMVFSQLPSSFSLSVTGSHFVSSSVIVFNGTTLPTTVVSSSQMTATITSSMISGPGSYGIQVHTPTGTSGNLGCSSGGNSSTLNLTVT